MNELRTALDQAVASSKPGPGWVKVDGEAWRTLVGWIVMATGGALGSQSSDGLGRSERAEERPARVATLPTAAQQERSKWRANERADRAEAALQRVLVDPRSGLDPITLLRDLCSPEWHDCTCDVHEAARYYLAMLDRKEPARA